MGEKGLGIKGWLAGPTDKPAQQKESTKTRAQALAVHLDKHRIAVLPFANISPNPADEYFADGLTEELISAVSKLDGLRTISRTSAMKYKDTSKSVEEIARELSVGSVLEGSVRKTGNRLRINMQLIDVQKDEPLCSESFDRELEDVFAIQSEIANCVARKLQAHLLAQERQPTNDMEAYTLYLQALHARGAKTEEGYKKAVELLQQALKQDPSFARAYEVLADCFDKMTGEGMLPPDQGYAKAREYAVKAISLDDTLAEAHATLAAILEEYFYDQPAADREFRKSMSLNPNFGRVCHSYGAHLAGLGRLDEAISEIDKAQKLNPLAMEVCDCAAVIYNSASQPQRSLEFCEKMLKMDENYYPAYEKMAEAYLQESRYDEAIEALLKASAISKGAATVKGRMGFAYAQSGRPHEARKILRELEEDSKHRYISPVAIAMVYCGLGEKDAALSWLEKACEERAGGVASLKIRPVWASLRSEPRFINLLNKMGLSA